MRMVAHRTTDRLKETVSQPQFGKARCVSSVTREKSQGLMDIADRVASKSGRTYNDWDLNPC